MGKVSYKERVKRKDEKIKEQQRITKKTKIKKMSAWLLVAAGILGFIIFLVFPKLNSQTNKVGEFNLSTGASHVSSMEEVKNWATNPPTSGSHSSSTLGAGFYDTEQSLLRIVHSLEHGAVAIYYKTSVSDEDKTKLKDFFNDNKRKKLIISPYNEMDANFALTAWQYIYELNEYNEEEIKAFFKSNYNNGPELASI